MPGIAMIDGLAMRPATGGPAAYGAGVAMSVVPRRVNGFFAFNGGFAVTPRSEPMRLDTFSFGADLGVKPAHENGDWLIPYAGVSARALAVSHYAPGEVDRFTTFAIGATAGVMGDIPVGHSLFYRAGATVLAAGTPDGVPGTSIVVRVGLGTRFGF